MLALTLGDLSDRAPLVVPLLEIKGCTQSTLMLGKPSGPTRAIRVPRSYSSFIASTAHGVSELRHALDGRADRWPSRQAGLKSNRFQSSMVNWNSFSIVVAWPKIRFPRPLAW